VGPNLRCTAARRNTARRTTSPAPASTAAITRVTTRGFSDHPLARAPLDSSNDQVNSLGMSSLLISWSILGEDR
jgi:hypothetical protein